MRRDYLFCRFGFRYSNLPSSKVYTKLVKCRSSLVWYYPMGPLSKTKMPCTTLEPDYVQSTGPSGRCQCLVVRGHYEVCAAPLLPKQRRCQMDGVQSSECSG